VGEVGYLITGVKDVRQSRVGDTVTSLNRPASHDLGGYLPPKPMVFAGLYPIDGADYPEFREALDKLQLNDAALSYEPETSGALGSDSGSASSACCTWRSSGSVWSANLILI
jgi:GTP-binding protein LepA